MRKAQIFFFVILASIAFDACASQPFGAPFQTNGSQHRGSASSPIQHVVVVIQENRSFDNLFATFPGANGATRGQERVKAHGKWVDRWVKLEAEPLAVTKYDLAHCRKAYLTDYDGGKMDGFAQEVASSCGSGPLAGLKPYHYADPADIQPYWQIAQEWVLADDMFQTQGSGSFTAHQDLIRGGTCEAACPQPSSSPSAAELSLVDNPTYWPWGCDANSSVLTYTLNIYGVEQENGPFPCSNDFQNYPSGYDTLATLLDGAGVSWKYYTPCFSPKDQPGCSPSSDCTGSLPDCNGSLLDAFDVIYPVRYGSEWGTNVSWPETNIFSDISNGALPAVSWVIPDDADSDHPKQPCGCDDGPSWVASVVNAIGESNYWSSSVIIVLWDDWGGFYDNAPPPFIDQLGGLGFRVPMLVISPYAIAGSTSGGYISHTQYEFGSILAYIEHNWNLGSLGTTDARATSIGNVFNYSQSPRGFTPIGSKYSVKYFTSRPVTLQHGDPE
jgi:phospholipase C